jgi:N-acetylmuramoyl-L-alanine amidase
VQSSTVNIRQSATTNSKIITTVKRGDKLKVTDKTASWYKIKTKAGKTGWVHASLVK